MDEWNETIEQTERDERLARRKALRARQRKRMENTLSQKVLFVQIGLILIIGLFLLIVPRSKVSNIEKRELARFPKFSFSSYFSGDFTAGITAFYDDAVPFRDTFKNIGNNIRSLFGLHTESQVEVIGSINKVEPVQPTPQPLAATDVEEKEPIQLEDYFADEAEGSVENGLLVAFQDGHWRGIQLFGGGSPTTFANGVNYLRRVLNDDVRIYVMPVPLQSEYYLPLNFTEYSASQNDFIVDLFEELDEGVEPVEIVSTLAEHRDEPIYLRTDHHWQPLGAYYAAGVFADVAGVPFPALEAYEAEEREGYVGSLYALTKSANILNDPETFTLYYPQTDYRTDYYDTAFQYDHTGNFFEPTDLANTYMTFMYGDEKMVKVTTEAGTGRRLLLLKDSYGNAEVSFYFSSFDEIYVVDLRYCEVNLVDFIESMDITDVLISEDIYSLAGDTTAAYLEQRITQNMGRPITDDAPGMDTNHEEEE